ncbi:MAG: serine/threonine-protein phosphatase [Streptosporangiaceae bacterium]|nr:serine/threonine-protein phosphatase [Streptosporangiaceae bacterium]
MSDEPEAAPARADGTPGFVLPAWLELLSSTSDPARLARLIVEAIVPGFADAAGVFVLEQTLTGGPADQPADTEIVVRRLATILTVAGCPIPGAVLPSAEVIAFAADSPYARCVHRRAPVIFSQPGSQTIQRVTRGARMALARYASFLAAPLIAQDKVLGYLVLGRSAGQRPFGDDDAATAADLAARAGTGIASSLAPLRPQPAVMPRPNGRAIARAAASRLEIAGRCLPAAGYDVGGDWYDILSLPGERTGLIVGDVMGHGPDAAELMTKLSGAAYAIAGLDLPPADVLRQLNRVALALPYPTLVTCAYAVIEPDSQSCTIATAGHLPPVLAMPGGTTRIPDLPAGQSLGVGSASYGQARIKLPPGAILAMYTDGLVETRTRPYDHGIRALRSLLARGHEHLDATCEQLITALSERNEDDITVVLARIRASHT